MKFPVSPSGLRLSAWLFCLATSLQAGVSSKPFAPASKGVSGKLFDTIPAAQSGVAMVPKVQNDHPLSFLYHSGFVVGGIAIGDLTGDGLPDLVIGGAAGSNEIYRNQGGFSFENITQAIGAGIDGGGRWTTGVTLADVDGDGDLDLFCCNYEAPNQLFLNQGPGANGVPAFKEVAAAAGVASVDSSHSASFVDYDRDGDLDLFLLTNKVEDPQGFPSKERAPVAFDGTNWRMLEGMDRYYALWKYDAKNSGVEPAGRPDLLFRNDLVHTHLDWHDTEICGNAIHDKETGRIEITAHNHGFAVKAPTDTEFSTVYGRGEVTHTCLNDGVVEGLALLDKPAFSVQYHPEAAAGPHDASYLFDRFVDLMSKKVGA